MRHPHLDTLHKFGLSTTEGEIYLALALAGAPMKARDIAAATGVPRGSVYPILNALADKGIVLNGQGYGSEFAAIPAREALPPLIGRDGQMRALLVRNEELAETLILAFELIWEKSKPITPVGATDASPATLAPSTKQQASVNCRRGRSAQK